MQASSVLQLLSDEGPSIQGEEVHPRATSDLFYLQVGVGVPGDVHKVEQDHVREGHNQRAMAESFEQHSILLRSEANWEGVRDVQITQEYFSYLNDPRFDLKFQQDELTFSLFNKLNAEFESFYENLIDDFNYSI
jgi:hypothetical protein